ncbi:MAG: Fpg/Nei family DNA glycosylase [Austwickia sp.]|nr:Fpg/Nei family DNA glycosylase [Austwickia sp.]
MPEGHTIHALARRIERRFGGALVGVSSPQGRFAAEAALLDGREIVGAAAAGKHLFVEFAGEDFLHVHLGLIGKFDVRPYGAIGRSVDPGGDSGGSAPDVVSAGPGPAALGAEPHAVGAEPPEVGAELPEVGAEPPAVGAIRCRLRNAGYVADLRGPNLCRVATAETVAAVLGRLGPDPLRPDADPDRGWVKIARSRKSIAELLMDQVVVAGVGNVYRCELLFRHRVDPHRPGVEIRPATWRAMWADLVRLLPLGVRFGQILTLPDQVEAALTAYDSPQAMATEEASTGGALGTTYERAFAVYKRTGEPCLTCGSRVRAELLAGRTLYWCGRCQRRR